MKISVYITSYNQKAYLAEAIESVLAQTVKPHEIIIVDDASSDGSQDFIRECADKHPGLIRPVFHECNRGVASTRNSAIAAATGDWLTYVDGDDRFLPQKIERESAAITNDPGVDLVYANYFNMSEDGSRLDAWVQDQPPPEGYILGELFARAFPRRDLFRFEMVRTDALRRVGGYDRDMATFEDFDLRIRLCKDCRVCYVGEPLAERRRHDEGLSAGPSSGHVDAIRYIYRKNGHLLCDLAREEQKRLTRGLLGWVAPFARTAAHDVLDNPSLPALHRRALAAKHLAFAARYAPDSVTFGDVLRLLLPAKTAERLNDQGPK